ncbi:MAG: DNA translocase FtsK [Candidatus Doudnabacteria bacterium]|nr:DNA translocase FtsK [Candidatus Doudnabacteria bacterium]
MSRKRNQNRQIPPAFKRPQLNLKKETRIGVAVVFFVVLAILFTLSLLGSAGKFGEVANQVLKLAFGWVAYVVPVIFVMVAMALMRRNEEQEPNTVSTHAYVGAVLLTLTLTGFLHLLVIRNGADAFEMVKQSSGGGYLGVLTAYPLVHLMGFVASLVILVAGVIVSLFVTFNVSFMALFRKKPVDLLAKPKQPLRINNAASAGFTKESVNDGNKAAKSNDIVVNSHNDEKISSMKLNTRLPSADKDWKFPPLDLLDDTKTRVDSGNIESNVSIIQKTLSDFGIDVEMGEVNVGPTVTQYTLRPAVGVKLSQIGTLQNDLALALAASSIRMELPIPGKGLVGLEVPNKSNAIVRIREIIASPAFAETDSKLAFTLGRDVAGHPLVSDLAKMPHLLIAGATGSGKSIGLNSILVSLLYRATPSEVKMILVDPKRVELSMYNGLPHLLTPVITDHQQAVNALRWTVLEMDRRYKMLQEVHKRNIGEFNQASLIKMPYLVVVVDELADLMSVSQNEVESAIVRLAQMARAVGIHLVLATQRPSVDVITGLIKANITARIAFAVASQVDSRTILDMSGAEKLLGQGDMLYITSDLPKPKRVQGTYVGEKEIKKVTEFIKEQAGMVTYDDQIVEKPARAAGTSGYDTEGDEDELLAEATNIVQQAGKASASLLQRRLRVGYARAARLLDIMEDKGIVGPGDGAKPREVYGATGSGENSESTIDDFQ